MPTVYCGRKQGRPAEMHVQNSVQQFLGKHKTREGNITQGASRLLERERANLVFEVCMMRFLTESFCSHQTAGANKKVVISYKIAQLSSFFYVQAKAKQTCLVTAVLSICTKTQKLKS
jgi:hypothetical protein